MSGGAKRKQLGRGLSSLLGKDTLVEEIKSANIHQVISISNIQPGGGQPRRVFDYGELSALAKSIEERGVLQPLLLRRLPADKEKYEIIAGERRWRAAQMAQLHEVPAVIKAFSDKEALEIGLIENIQRSDLQPLEEADAFQRLIDEYGHTQELVAKAVGKSRSYVANSLRLLALPVKARDYLEAGRITAGHARALLVSPEAEKLADYVVSGGLSVRATEKLVQDRLNDKKSTGLKAARRKKLDLHSLNPDILALEQSISEKTGLKVEVKSKEVHSGSVTVHYQTLDQFDHVVKKLTS
ncbi:MAG: chromosome partitioning protein ParB [Rhodospirillaceae bacterium]|nr:chromosome partitioning protein ParB [Rhodospirillaceae bacterium]